MEDLKKTFWLIEELIYINFENEDLYNNKEKEIIKNISILFKNFSNENSTENLSIELNEKALKEIILEITNFFNVLKLVKTVNHKNCITHPWVYDIFKFIKEIAKNDSVVNINQVKKEVFEFFFKEKKKQIIKYRNNFFLNTCFIFINEIKILLCCCILLNIFVQYNWTGPPLNCDFKKLKEQKIQINDSDNYFKEFMDAINIKNDEFLNSCLEFLSLEGEYIYEYSELIYSFCMCIILLGIINNFNDEDQHMFSLNEYNYFKINLNDPSNNKIVHSISLKEKENKESNNINTECITNHKDELQEDKIEKKIKEKKYDELKLLYFIKSKYLWKARIYFIWQRLFVSSNDYFYFLKIHIIDKPFNIFKNIKLLPEEFELIEQEVNLRAIDIFDHLNENMKDIEHCDLFFENYMSEKLKIYLLSNFSIYLAFYNYTSGYKKIMDIISELSQFHYSFTGRMGIKRKYQKIPATILVLKTKLKDEEDNTSTILKEIDPFSEYDILKSDYKIIENETNEYFNKCKEEETNDLRSEDHKSLKREEIDKKQNEQQSENKDSINIEKLNEDEFIEDVFFCKNELNNKKLGGTCCDNNNADKNIYKCQNGKLEITNNNYKTENCSNNSNKKKNNDYNSINDKMPLKKYVSFKDEKMINIPERECEENNNVAFINIDNKKAENKNDEKGKYMNNSEANDSEKESSNRKKCLEEPNGKVTWKLKDLDPDTDILEEPFFVDSQNNYFKILSFQEQIILINYCFSLIRFNPHYDEIKFEKLSAVISRCLKCYDVNATVEKENEGKNNNYLLQIKYQNWLLHSCILWFKCKYETFKFKTVDRAAAQLNELLKECYELEPKSIERLKFIYDVYYPTTWEMKKEIGKVMIKIGSMISAFNIFKDLKLWEEAITCLIEAGRKEEAKELLDDIIQKKRTPALLCLYGLIDRNNALNYYEDAWNLSNFKYSKAARFIGKYYYNKEMYKECCEYLEKSLEISPLFSDIWFILGCSYMKIDKFDEAIKSFTRMISMTNENCAKSYGNLAYLYMKKGTYKAAKICINQAVKVNNNEWKFWDTYLKLSILQNDVDSFCLSIRTLCQLNQVKQIQPWVFDYISDLIVKDKPTFIQNKNGLSYLDKMITTMDNLSIYITEYDSFWNAYSFFLFIKGKFTDSFDTKIKEIRSIESIIQKCNTNKIIEAMVSKQTAAIKFLYHIIKNHDIGEKRGTFIYQLKNIIESTLIQYKNISQEDVKELLEIKKIMN
ncbi:conserved Plasmodium protein, unknown function [Plasmodium gallinaceum]|uniref:Uncharacterized protein n=1 Tax=Plasmodium gallinaceum TaxID=5849 RepID=A0A1J1GZ38_PLAGA|nr:conserved Plasmodium protein, unknown function [Plasmodium gallinaceum]CRG97497.1 conserved Plasmodium protein, unknown function [Plasmodium gallinaceum]